MSVPRALKSLKKIPYFSNIPSADLEDIAGTAVKKTYAADDVVFWEGDPSTGLYVIEDGWFKIIKISPNGREQVIKFVGPEEAFNALSLFANIPNPATAMALESATVWLIPNEIMLGLLDTYPKLARGVIQILAGRVQYLVGMVEDLSLRSVESRLARLLLEQASDETVQRQQWATQTEIAARIGTVTDVLSRALRKLTEESLISVTRHQIKILDPVELKVRADNE
ncbi:MAG: Crp/Fnr family transcriptional regulator [Chloroflexota bacterium]